MATLESGTHIPPEILGLIISKFQDRNKLANLSLVSHLWHRLAFPVLWYEVQLLGPSHLDKFATHIQSELPDNFFSVSVHLRALYISLGGASLDRDLLIRFQEIIPKLSFLTHLTWSEYVLHEAFLLQTFQQSCRALRSVDLHDIGHSTDIGRSN